MLKMPTVLQMLVAGWKALGMVKRGEFVGIIGFASMDWLVSDIATTYVGSVMSPLPTNILVEDIKHLIQEAEVIITWHSADDKQYQSSSPLLGTSRLPVHTDKPALSPGICLSLVAGQMPSWHSKIARLLSIIQGRLCVICREVTPWPPCCSQSEQGCWLRNQGLPMTEQTDA